MSCGPGLHCPLLLASSSVVVCSVGRVSIIMQDDRAGASQRLPCLGSSAKGSLAVQDGCLSIQICWLGRVPSAKIGTGGNL